jgi:hypothetical protein
VTLGCYYYCKWFAIAPLISYIWDDWKLIESFIVSHMSVHPLYWIIVTSF